jgi:hypothetical protein
VPPVEVRPQGVEEDQLGVRRLPQQEVRRALLAGRADEQVHVGQVRLVEEPGDGALVDPRRVQSTGGRLPGDGRGGIGDLRATAVVDAELQREHPVVAGEVLGGLQLRDDAAPQPGPPARPPHPHPHRVHLVAASADDVAVEAHEEAHLLRRALPVLGGERVRGQAGHPDLDRAADGVEQGRLPRLVARRARQAALLRPPAVAVHDQRDVSRHEVAGDGRRDGT